MVSSSALEMVVVCFFQKRIPYREYLAMYDSQGQVRLLLRPCASILLLHYLYVQISGAIVPTV
jgi:hypothetical protein